MRAVKRDQEGVVRHALVTGASSGIGLATTYRLLQDGHRVLGLARDFTEFPYESSSFQRVEIDLGDLDGLPEELASLAREQADVDAVVFNAGRGEFGSLEEFSYEAIRSLVELDFISQAFLARAFLPAMKRRGAGDLVFIGSEAALAGKRKGSLYCASKAALRAFAQALREECAASGVRVSLINPGSVRTPFFDRLDFAPGEDPANYIEADDVARVVSMILSSRPGTVFDEVNLSPLKKVLRFRKGKDRKPPS